MSIVVHELAYRTFAPGRSSWIITRPDRHSALFIVSSPASVNGAETPAMGSGRMASGTPVGTVSMIASQHAVFPVERAGRGKLADAVDLPLEVAGGTRPQQVDARPVRPCSCRWRRRSASCCSRSPLARRRAASPGIGHVLRHHRDADHVDALQLLADAGEKLDVGHGGRPRLARLRIDPEDGVVPGGDLRPAGRPARNADWPSRSNTSNCRGALARASSSEARLNRTTASASSTAKPSP